LTNYTDLKKDRSVDILKPTMLKHEGQHR
jgi:hypothetical protein